MNLEKVSSAKHIEEKTNNHYTTGNYAYKSKDHGKFYWRKRGHEGHLSLGTIWHCKFKITSPAILAFNPDFTAVLFDKLFT